MRPITRKKIKSVVTNLKMAEMELTYSSLKIATTRMLKTLKKKMKLVSKEKKVLKKK